MTWGLLDLVQPRVDPYNTPTPKTTLVPNMWIAHYSLFSNIVPVESCNFISCLLLPSHTKSSSNVLRINGDVMWFCLRRQVNWPYMWLAKIAPLDRPSPKTHPRTKHGVDRTTGCGDMVIWNFRNERSVVGRRSVVNIHTYIDLIYSSSLR